MKKILIVDDDYPIADAIRLALAPMDSKVTICSNGTDALRAIGSVRPDLVILDIMLPGMSGLEVLRTIRTMPGHEKTPVILITGTNAQVGDQRQYGWSAFVRKPFSLDKFYKTVEKVLNEGTEPSLEK